MKNKCFQCVHSTRLYYEGSLNYEEFHFIPAKNACYCTLLDEVVINHKNCKEYLNAWDDLKDRLREEDHKEENLPF